MGVGMAVVAVAVAATLAAGLRFDQAADAVQSGDLAAARDDLDAAVTLDPGMALYVRQRGISSLLLGDLQLATRDLTAATHLNENDDQTWRALAIALRERGDVAKADDALDEAIDVQRSDKSSLMLRAAWLLQDGRSEELHSLLPEITLAWPTALAAPGWEDVAGDLATPELVSMAIDRWQRGLPSAEPPRAQPFLLIVLGERADLASEASGPAELSEQMGEAAIAVGWCEPVASELLETMPTDDQRSSAYWGLRVQHAAEHGASDPTALSLYELITFTEPSFETATSRMNPLRENSERGSADAWGYDRVVIRWEDSPVWLPLPQAGADLMLLDPRGARSSMRMPEGPGSCTAP